MIIRGQYYRLQIFINSLIFLTSISMFAIFLNAFSVLSSGVGGIFSLLHLILIAYCFYNVWTSPSAMSTKVLWSLAIFFLPIVGPVLYLLFGR